MASSLPLPKDLRHHLSYVSKSRDASSIKAFYKYFAIPGIGNLAGGLPNVKFFPYDTLEAQVAKPERWSPTPNDADDANLAASLASANISPQDQDQDAAAATHLTIAKSTSQADPTRKIDLETALQYGDANGYPPLRSFIRQFTRNQLHPTVPYRGGPEVILTCGSTDGFGKAIDMIVDPWRADRDPVAERPAMLCEVFAYGNALSAAKPKGVRVVTVEIDGEGMMASGPGGLQDVLENWDTRNGRRPHFIYTVTLGHNPTSGVLSVKRRKELYALCCKYDILIIEDDPYWYLQFPSAAEAEALSRGLARPKAAEPFKPQKSSGYEFLDSLVPSYLSIDTEGRVIRLDTFSKTIAPGCRLGWITTQPMFIERLQRGTETSTQQPSGFVQSVVAETIMGPQTEAATKSFLSLSRSDQLSFSGWDVSGWVRWLSGLRGMYERRMNRMCDILEEGAFQLKQSTPVNDADADWGVVTKTRLLSFDWPRGGMFIWLRVHHENHPLWLAKGNKVPLLDGPILANALFILCTHKPHRVLPAPGSMFAPTPEIAAERGWRFVRLCFAAETEENIDIMSRRLVNAVQKFWRIKDVAEMEKLVLEYGTASMDNVEGLGNLGYSVGMGC